MNKTRKLVSLCRQRMDQPFYFWGNGGGGETHFVLLSQPGFGTKSEVQIDVLLAISLIYREEQWIYKTIYYAYIQ